MATHHHKIAILGGGNVGGALGKKLGQKGHHITYGTRDPNSEKIKALLSQTPNSSASTNAEAVKAADVVILSTPWEATKEVILSAGDLTGKVVIDATNPLAKMALAVGHTTSGGEQVASWAKGAKVVKAFNTIGYNIMENPESNGVKADLHIAGDDPEAKKIVANIAKDVGFVPLDVGGLTQARLTEPLAMLWISMAYAVGHGREHFFKYLPESTKGV